MHVRPSTPGSAPIASSVTADSPHRGISACPVLRDGERVHRIVARGGDAHRHRHRPQRRVVGRAVFRGLGQRVGQVGPLRGPRPGEGLRQPRRAARAHRGGHRLEPGFAQRTRGMGGGERGRRGRRSGGITGPRGQRRQHRERPVGMSKGPVQGHGRADGDAAGKHVRAVARRVVERVPVAGDQPARVRFDRDRR